MVLDPRLIKASLAICALLSTGGFTAYAERAIRFSHLDVQQAGVEGSIQAMGRDKRGDLWFGTAHGLSRFDGYQMRLGAAPALTNSSITAICPDSDGLRLWIGTANDGLFLLNSDGSLHRHLEVDGGRIEALASGQETLWVATLDGGISRLTAQGNHMEPAGYLSEGTSVSTLLETLDGTLLVGTLTGQLLRLGQGKFTQFYLVRA